MTELDMKTRLIAGWLLCLLAFAPLYAQTGSRYSVEGLLADSVTQAPIPYATIHIALKSHPEKAVVMAVTDDKGHFKQPLPEAGEYLITLSSVGNRTVEQAFTIDDQERRKADLGTLFTSEAIEELGGVTVTARKPLVKAEADKLTYDVEADPDSETKNVLDMLRKVPLVTVDGEDNIRLNGKTDFKIYLNGRPAKLFASNPGKILKGMPASSVKDIAVITSPGAKYDAEGVGGIIDIITTERSALEGYTATFNAGANTLGGWNAGANAMIQTGKLSLSGQYGYYTYQTTLPGGIYRTEYLNDPQMHTLTTGNRATYKSKMHYGNIEASYEIDTLNLLTFALSYSPGNSRINNSKHSVMDDEAGNRQYAYDILDESYSSWGSIEASANYQRTLRKKEELLTLSYIYSHSPADNRRYQTNSAHTDLRTANDAWGDEHTAQIDYVNPFDDRHSVEAGLKYIFRNNQSESLYETIDPATGLWQPIRQDLSDFDHRQHIAAAYVAYTFKYKRFGLKAGSRAEHAWMKARLHSNLQPDFGKNYWDIVPTGNLSWQLSDTRSLRATYNLRIARPSISYLNPYRDSNDPHIVAYGNPNLKTEKYHHAGIAFSSFAQALMLNAELSYDRCGNAIESYSRTTPGNVLETTYGNIGRLQSATLSLYANINIGTSTSISVNSDIIYKDLRGKALNAHAHGWNGQVYAGFQQNLPWKLRLGAYGGYFGRDITLQGKLMSAYYYGLYLSRSFLKDDRLTVSLSGQNPFNRYLKMNMTTQVADFRSHISQRQEMRNFSLSLSYRLGDLKATVKKTARSIVNDDLKAGKGNGPAGGAQGR